LFHVKFHGVALPEIFKVEPLKAAAVKEKVPPVIGVDKTEPTVTNDLLNCPLHIHLARVKAGVLGWSKKEGGTAAEESAVLRCADSTSRWAGRQLAISYSKNASTYHSRVRLTRSSDTTHRGV
jgi:hypothetical protein